MELFRRGRLWQKLSINLPVIGRTTARCSGKKERPSERRIVRTGLGVVLFETAMARSAKEPVKELLKFAGLFLAPNTTSTDRCSDELR